MRRAKKAVKKSKTRKRATRKELDARDERSNITARQWAEWAKRRQDQTANQGRKYGIRIYKTPIKIAEVAEDLHEFLDRYKYALRDGEKDDAKRQSEAQSKALDVELKRLTLEKRRGDLIPAEDLRAGFERIIEALQRFGEKLDREFGPRGAELLRDTLNELADVFAADIERASDM